MVGKNLGVLLVVLMLSVVTVFAQTGKIRGKVVDGATGEAIPGATVMVEGTQLGASTMANGEYFILQVPPGIHKVKCLIVGYTTLTQENIIISSDTTTTVDFKMSTKIAGQEDIVVQAKKPIVQKDVTSSQKTFDSQQISKLVNPTMTGVLEQTAGVVTGGDGALHVRGGRDGEVAYYIDGILVNSGFDGGNSFNLDSDSIEEMKVMTGGFNAEFGGAMSGIITAVSKSGQKEFHGKVSYKTSKFYLDKYFDQFGDHQYTANVSGPIPNPFVKDASFTLSASFLDDNGMMLYRDNAQFLVGHDGHSMFQDTATFKAWADRMLSGAYYNPAHYPSINPANITVLNANIRSTAEFMMTNNGFYDPYYYGYTPQEYNRTWRYSGVISMRPEKSVRLKFAVNQNAGHYFRNYDQSGTSSGNTFVKYVFRNAPATETVSSLYTVSATHTLNQSMYYDVSVSLQSNEREWSVNGTHYTDFIGWEDDTVHVKNVVRKYNRILDNYSYYFLSDTEDGLAPVYSYSKNDALKLQAAMTWQVDRINQVKFGVSYNRDSIDYEYYNSRTAELSGADKYDVKPYNINAYVQDKIEIEDMIINVGLRMEHYNPNSQYYEDPGLAVKTHNLVQSNGNPLKGAYPTEGLVDAETKTYFMPRVGISYPLSDTGAFRFSYGHFYQYPSYDVVFTHLSRPVAGDYYGNANIDAQKSVQFEVGFQQGLSDILGFSLTGYYKEATDVLSVVNRSFSGKNFYMYVNKDFARILGLDISIERRFYQNFSFDVSYGFMMAKGSASTPTANVSSLSDDTFIPPVKAQYLDYDRRHSVSGSVAVAFGRKEGFEMFGVKPLENSSLSLRITAESGLPYTRTNLQGDTLGEVNDSRAPWTKSVDLRFSKGFNVYKNVVAKFIVESENIFDWENIQKVDPTSGIPYDNRLKKDDFTFVNAATGLVNPSVVHQYQVTKEGYTNLQQYGAPRTLRVGVEVSF